MTNKYIDKEEFREELTICINADVISNRLGKMFLDIATNLVNHRHFVRYPIDLKYDLIGEGVERCCKGYKKFDPTFGTSPLAYFTQTCYNANRAFLGKEYKKINTVNQLKEEHQLDLIEELADYT